MIFNTKLTHTILTHTFLTRSLTVLFVLKRVKKFLAFPTLLKAHINTNSLYNLGRINPLRGPWLTHGAGPLYIGYKS